MHHVAQFMSEPRTTNLIAVKHNLFYLKGTVYYVHDFPSSGCPDTNETTNDDVYKF